MRKINNLLISVFEKVIMIMIPLMTGVVFLQVVMRYIFLSPFEWGDEAARYLMIWVSCLGAAIGVRKGIHIGIIFIKNKLSQTMQTSVSLITYSLVIAFFIFCFIEGFILSLSEWNQTTPGLKIRITWVFLSIPVGFGVMIMFSLELMIEDVKKLISFKKEK